MDWDKRYRDKDTPWEKGSAAPPLLEYLENHRVQGRVLVPGCGTGHEVRALAAQGADALGIDLSPAAIHLALANPPPDQGLARYRVGDFLSPVLMETLSESFDHLFEHTCFCAIDPSQRTRYAQAAASALKPTGLLLGIFFTHLERESGPPYATPETLIDSVFSPYFEIEKSWRPKKTFPGREGEESMILMRKRS